MSSSPLPAVHLSRRLLLLGALALPLASCAGTYATDYAQGVAPEQSRAWHVTAVRVSVPRSLTVSEVAGLVPRADIVWREDDPQGDRRAQVGAIMQAAIARAASGLKGRQAVVFEVTVTRFHALSMEAETMLSDAGVHNIQFDIAVLDARTGAVLAGPTHIQADLPALSGELMREARARGESQKSQISAHVTATMQSWLGIGPDVRGTFMRLGD